MVSIQKLAVTFDDFLTFKRFRGMFRFVFLLTILLFSSNILSQPNNGVAFINNLPNMTVGESYEIIIDGNGNGGITLEVDNLDGTYNCDIEKWVFIAGNWIFSTSTCCSPFGDVTWVQGQKMIARAISDIGNNPCSSVSGEDHIFEFDSFGNNVDNIVCVYSGTLPLEWLAKTTAIIKSKTAQITWSVANQTNNNRYIIEHSNDGRNFSIIRAIAGNGTSTETKHYEYIQTSPSIGINYYRIKQVDYDSKYSYSNIATVSYGGAEETSIYPNPATSEVTITTQRTNNTTNHGCVGQITQQAGNIRRTKHHKPYKTSIGNPYLCGWRLEI